MPAAPHKNRRPRLPRPLGLDVAQRLQALILDGTLRPGERLNEVLLARSLGTSRGPVREAARALEKTGLVRIVMNRGAFVRDLDIAEATELYEISGLIFGLAAARAAIGMTAAQRLMLRIIVAAMDQAIAQHARESFLRLNADFHMRLLAFAGNREAEALYAQLDRKLTLLRRRSFECPGRLAVAKMAKANAEHRALLRAMLRHDAAQARRLAEAHAGSGHRRFLEAIGDAAPDGTDKGDKIMRMPQPSGTRPST